jgi:hypothetical protein
VKSWKLKGENRKQLISEIQTKFREIKTIKKMFFCMDFPWLLFGFPRFFRKSKQKNCFCIVLFGFCRFLNWISRIFFWIPPVSIFS